MSELIVTLHDDALVVTSDTVADGAGIQHASVLRLLDDNLPDFEEFGQVGFEIRAGYNNARVRVALLNEQQATLVMTFLRNTEQVRSFKKQLVRAFYDMARGMRAEPSADEIVRQAFGILDSRVKELEAKVETDAPKVEYVDKFVAVDDDAITFRVASAQLSMGEHALRDALLDAGWIHRVLIGQRWSGKAGRIVDEHEYRPSSAHRGKFTLRPQHNAPRHHNGQVRQTLYILAASMPAIQRRVQTLALV